MTQSRTIHTAPESLPALRDQLAWETLGTEKQRIIVLLVFAGLLSLVSLIPPPVMSGQLGPIFHGNLGRFMHWRLVVLAVLTVYLVAERILLSYLIKKQQRIPPIHRYLTTLIEMSAPTAATIVTATYADPSSTLASVPVCIYPVFIVLSALRLNISLSLFTGVVAAIQYFAVERLYVEPSVYWGVHLSKALALMMLGLITGLVALQLKKRMMAACKIATERNQVVQMFGEHVSPAVVDTLLAGDGNLKSEKQNICVMFLDIRNFTSFAEKRCPEEVVAYLDTLFEFMIEIINRRQGIINKFLGDGFMAVFGAPTSNGCDELNAVTAAREIIQEVNRRVAANQIPPTRVGIGLHAGQAVTGSIGSSLRREYTVIGDVVNLASRIEKLNKEFRSELLISEAVLKALPSEAKPDSIPIGQIAIRGREMPVGIYRLG